MNGDQMLALPDLDAVLHAGPLRLETGVERLASGVLHVAARTNMPYCTGDMFAWWFRFAPDTEQYSWWHPLDHVSSHWRETSPQTHVGSTHIVEERLGTEEVHVLHIHFVDAGELFGPAAVDEALERGDVSTIVAAQLGNGPEPLRDEHGRPNMGRVAHVARNTPDGMVLRSNFWLGAGMDAPRQALEETIPEELGLGLMVHATTEFTYLSRFLPSLYAGAHPDSPVARLPW